MKIKITKVNASFSLKKNLERFENADIWFSAEAEVGEKDNPEDVAKSIHDFCKKLAVEKYNNFSRNDLVQAPSKTAEEEYGENLGNGEPIKTYKPRPGEIEAILEKVTPKDTYIATERDSQGRANKVKVTKEMIEENHKKTIIH